MRVMVFPPYGVIRRSSVYKKNPKLVKIWLVVYAQKVFFAKWITLELILVLLNEGSGISFSGCLYREYFVQKGMPYISSNGFCFA